MRQLTLLLLLSASLIINGTLNAQRLKQQPETWAVRTGGEGIEHATAVTSDANGNLYVTGGLQMKDVGNTQIFLSKYGRDGQALWQIDAGSDTLIYNTLSEYGTDVLSVGDYVYVAGTFLSSARFADTRVKSHGFDDIFLAKYSTSGTLIWIETAGGPSQDLVHSLAADKDGNVYITGSFQRQAEFGDKVLLARNSTEMYVAKFSPDGKLVWAKQSENQAGGVGIKIRCEENHCLIAGEYRGASGDENKIVLTTIQQLDGAEIDAKVIFSQPNVSVNDFIIDNSNLYLTGSFAQNLNTGAEKLIASRGGFDSYLVKLDASGRKLWNVSIGGPFFDRGQSLSIDKKNDHIILVGSFQNQLNVSDSLINGFGADDIFMTTVTKDGVVADIEVFGGAGGDQARDSELLNGSLIMTGHFRDVAKLRDVSITSAGASDVLLAKVQLKTSSKSSLEETSSIVKVHPNPSKGTFILSSSSSLEEIEICNTLGQKLSNFKVNRISDREAEIKADGSFRGVCVVTVAAGYERVSHKVIIE